MNKKDTLVLIVRLIVGGIFIYAGWMKVADMSATVGFFSSLGIPAFLAYAVAYIELIAGILLVLGLFLYADIVALALTVIMVGAVYYTHSGGFQMFSTPLATLAALLGLLATGPGRYAFRGKKA